MKTTKSAFIWNMLGSLANAASTMLLLMLVGRAQGEASAGIFSTSLAISQLFATIGHFEVRTYQSSDLNEKFKFGDYYLFRIITCFFMLIFSFGYIFYSGYTGIELDIIILMCLYKGLDSFTDVFYGMFQQKNRLEIAGKSMFFRVVTCTIAFAIAVYQCDNLLIPTIFLVIISIFWILFYDYRYARFLESKWNLRISEKLISLFFECLPLCICSFISIYLINSPKYAIASFASNDIQGIFGYIFMPTSVINLFSIFILRPIIGDLSVSWNENNDNKFLKLVLFVVGWILLLTVCVLIGGYFLGIPILSLFYATDLSAYKYELLVILMGGGMSALTTAFYYILTVMRQQKKVLYIYIGAFPITAIIVPKLSYKFGLIGASYGYLIAMSILAVGLVIMFLYSFKYERK